jgi:hypothetical protein
MNKTIKDTVPLIINKLKEKNAVSFKAFLGFDACIDNIVREERIFFY